MRLLGVHLFMVAHGSVAWRSCLAKHLRQAWATSVPFVPYAMLPFFSTPHWKSDQGETFMAFPYTKWFRDHPYIRMYWWYVYGCGWSPMMSFFVMNIHLQAISMFAMVRICWSTAICYVAVAWDHRVVLEKRWPEDGAAAPSWELWSWVQTLHWWVPIEVCVMSMMIMLHELDT